MCACMCARVYVNTSNKNANNVNAFSQQINKRRRRTGLACKCALTMMPSAYLTAMRCTYVHRYIYAWVCLHMHMSYSVCVDIRRGKHGGTSARLGRHVRGRVSACRQAKWKGLHQP